MAPKELTWWIWALSPHRQYEQFEVRKRDGSQRRISAPIAPIKAMQRRLATALQACYQPPVYAHGFVDRRSPETNARPHVGKQWVLRVDIAEFFPSINFGRVRGLFMAYPFDYPHEVATVLAQICCHENQLPQGAPTSPVVSNYICRSMDTDLGRLARRERCHYTRYADDITFSTDRTVFPGELGFLDQNRPIAGRAVVETIENNGFELNEDKTRLTPRTQRQRVTGLVVNEKVNVSRAYIRDLQ